MHVKTVVLGILAGGSISNKVKLNDMIGLYHFRLRAAKKTSWLRMNSLLAIFFLAACGRGTAMPTATRNMPAVSTVSTVTLEVPGTEKAPAGAAVTETAATNYPGPELEPTQSVIFPDTYPGIEDQGPANPVVATPYPEMDVPDSGEQPGPLTPYPGIGTEQAPTINSTPGSTPPSIGGSPSPSAQTTAFPEVTGTPSTIIAPESTSIPPSVTPTLTPSLTPTLTEPDPKFHPTDPEDVELVSGKVQLVEFFAYWCGTCRAMAPIIHRIEDRYEARMNFVYLDVDNPATLQLKRDFGYKHLPHLFLVDAEGKILRSWGGSVSAAILEEAIRGALD